MWGHALDDEPCGITRLVGIAFPIEFGWCQLLGTIKCAFAISTQFAGNCDKPVDVSRKTCRQSASLGHQDSGNIMHAWRVNTDGAQQALQGEFNGFLRLPDYVSPTPGIVEDLYRPQARRAAFDEVTGKAAGGLCPVGLSVDDAPNKTSGGDRTADPR